LVTTCVAGQHERTSHGLSRRVLAGLAIAETEAIGPRFA
jgi:hypothetical protein